MSKPFNVALCVSCLWHLTLGTVFCVVITSASFGDSNFGVINFVGSSLLEDLKQQAPISQESLLMKVDSGYSRKVSKKLEAKLPKLDRASIEDKTILYMEMPHIRMAGALGSRRLAPSTAIEIEREEYEPIVSQIKGPAASREVVFKPQLPGLVRWPQKIEQDMDVDSFEVEVKFWVSPEGKVQFVEKLRSCGYFEVDTMATRYMRMWQFAPLKTADGKSSQWGRVKLNFRQVR
ncbi:MAG: energy transducer TonB [Candidatus Omnitrophota bacterium]